MSRRRVLILSAAILAVAGTSAYLLHPCKQEVRTQANPQADILKRKALPLHPVVEKIVREGTEIPYLKLNYLIKELPLDLADHDITALIRFISGPQPRVFQDAEWGSLVNDIEEALTVQTVPSPLVVEALINIYRDESRIPLQRDYALQHVGGFAIYLVHTEAVSSPLLPRLTEELQRAASDGSKPWCGTAFNLLDGLLRAAEYRSVQIPDLSVESLVKMAVPVAGDVSAPLNARLPALQVATRRDSPVARDLAREIISSPDPGVLLTQAASAALARLGTAEDLPMLQAASTHATPHTAPAINEAIRAIKGKFHVIITPAKNY